MSVEAFAEHLGVGTRTVNKWDAYGTTTTPLPALQQVLDVALERATPAQHLRFLLLLRAASTSANSGQRPDEQVALARPNSFGDGDGFILGLAASRPEGDEDVNRRQMLVQLGMMGFTASLLGAESVRQGLAATLTGDEHAAGVDEWELIGDEYAHAHYSTPVDRLLRDLTADLSVLQQTLTRGDDASRRSLARVAGQLSAISAMAWAGAGETRQARRWWRTARALADRSGDPETRMFVRAWEVVSGLYEERPIPVILDWAAEASAIREHRVSAPTAGLYAGLAQTLAVAGRRDEALAALERVIDITDQMPPQVMANEDSMHGWPEVRLRHTESYVHTWLGDTTRAHVAQETALRLYPEGLVRDRAAMLLHRAICMIREGDVGGGLTYAADVLDDLPERYRRESVYALGRAAMQFVPPSERARPEAVELRDRLAASSAGTSA